MCVYCVKCTKFGKLFLRKVIKTVSTRCLDLSSKRPKMRLAAGLRPDPLGELKRSPRPHSHKRGLLLRGGGAYLPPFPFSPSHPLPLFPPRGREERERMGGREREGREEKGGEGVGGRKGKGREGEGRGKRSIAPALPPSQKKYFTLEPPLLIDSIRCSLNKDILRRILMHADHT